MKPLLDEIRDAGFIPGLWIAPHLVGNRSRLFAEHPDWVVRDRRSGGPLAAMRFYGEFRWHKRSEEYYILDVTHPDAAAYIAGVFRTWRRAWGCAYFKTDFMHIGSAYGPDRAVWHEAGLSRIEVFMRMARLIRKEIGDALARLRLPALFSRRSRRRHPHRARHVRVLGRRTSGRDIAAGPGDPQFRKRHSLAGGPGLHRPAGTASTSSRITSSRVWHSWRACPAESP